MNLKVVLLTIFLAIGFSFHNCSNDYDCSDCTPIESEYFDIQGMNITTSKVGATEQQSSEIQLNETVSFENFKMVSLIFSVNYIAQNWQKKNLPSFSLMNTAYGCSCVYNGISGSKEEVLENITFITLNDFDNEHLTNDTINDLLKMRVSNSIGGKYYSTEIEAYLLSDSTNIKEEWLQFELQKAPEINTEFKIKAIIELSTGEIYEAESLPIFIE